MNQSRCPEGNPSIKQKRLDNRKHKILCQAQNGSILRQRGQELRESRDINVTMSHSGSREDLEGSLSKCDITLSRFCAWKRLMFLYMCWFQVSVTVMQGERKNKCCVTLLLGRFLKDEMPGHECLAVRLLQD
ncbi:hypothetical protein CEXT_775331 [Caerostris extrusa]|uniref:Uncharacterized protein n=1 Tax=Caerostris extrusa TaxID=172846 RepID=A0AAV4MIT8_CAEEX|nr:hypothetical protein CEXT_775331 [Caerostris extrusa]